MFCKGKGLFSESAPIPLHPLTLKTPHISLPPYSLRGIFVIADTFNVPVLSLRGFAEAVAISLPIHKTA